jgi:recombination associated protein RdgC
MPNPFRLLAPKPRATERDDIRAELDARFALMAGELKRLFSVLEPALKLSSADA